MSAFAGPNRTTYQAKIIKPDGYPLEAANVNFKFTILDPAGTCILYSETHSAVNMASTGGVISFSLGSGVKTYPVSSPTFADVFSNITPSLSCDVGGPVSYSPAANDIRKIVMQFHDGSGWQTLPAMNINAVPYAMYADDSQKLGGVSATSYVRYSTIPTCAASEAVHYNGTSFSCLAVDSGGGVTSGSVVTALGYTPANSATVTTLTSSLATTDLNVSSVSSTVNTLAGNIASVSSTVNAMTSSQWSTSGSAISYSSGNVGIGTSNPAYQLHVMKPVSGATAVGIDAFGSTPGIYMRRANGTAAAPQAVSATDALLEIAAVGYGQTGFINTSAAKILMSSDENWTNATGAASIRFHTRGVSNTGASIERMRIANNGYVGIGTSAPVTTLDVSGGVRIGTENSSCSSTYAGTLRYNSGVVEYCNGTTWSAFGVAGAGLLALNGLTSGSQTFSFGSTGTTPNVSSTGSVHTFNFPFASVGTTTAGLISNADYVNFNSKLNATSSSIISALSYTPADQAAVNTSFTSVANSLAAASTSFSTVATSFTTVNSNLANLSTSMTGLSASMAAVTSSQWVTSGTTISYSTGNVGIATSAPRQNVDVAPAAGNAIFRATTTNAAAALQLYQNQGGGNYRGPVLWSNGTTLYFGHDTSENAGATLMALTPSGYLGVGTLTPSDVLHVQKAVDARAIVDSISGSTGLELRTSSVSSAGGAYIDFATSSTSHTSPDYDFRIIADNVGFKFQTPGSNSRMLINSAGDVGIGTTLPSAKLHLAAGTTSNASLKLTSGTLLTAPQSGTIEYDGVSLYYTDGANVRRQLLYDTAGNYSVTNVTSPGNMFFTPNSSMIVSSTTASTNSSTGALIVNGGLGVAGNINASGTLNVTGVATFGNAIHANGNIHTGGNNRGFWMDTPGSFNYGIWRDSTDTVHLRSGGTTNRLTIASATGNVGIGTSNPGAQLHVMERQAIENNLNTAAGPNLSFWKNRNYAATQNHDELGYISFYGHDGSTTLRSAYIIANAEGNPTAGSVPGGIRFFTTTAGQPDSTEKMRISASGTVGIGTTAPAYPLDVSGTVRSSGLIFNAPPGDPAPTISTRTVPAGQGAANEKTELILFHTNDFNNGAGPDQITLRAPALSFQTYNNATVSDISDNNGYNERMYISPTGAVGIGTTNPLRALHVVSPGSTEIMSEDSTVASATVGRIWRSRSHGGNYYLDAMNSDLTGGLNIMTATSGGAVGIGVGTTVPGAKFEVSNGASAVVRVLAGTGAGVDDNNLLRLMPQDTTGEGGHVEFKGSANFQDWAVDTVGGDLRFFEPGQSRNNVRTRGGITFSMNTSANSTPAVVDTLKIAGTGRVGIGTFSPTNTLTVSNTSTTNFNPATNVNSAIMVGPAAGSHFGGGVLLKDFTYYAGMWSNNSGNSLVFGAGGTAGGFTNLTTLVVASSGSVGVGTATPTEKLEVVGNVKVSGEIYSTKSWGFKKGPSAFVSDYINAYTSGYHVGTSIDCTSSANGCTILKAGTYEIRCVHRANSTTSVYIGIGLNGDRTALESRADAMWNHDHSVSPGGYTESNFMGTLSAGNFITCGPANNTQDDFLIYAAAAYNGTITIKRID